jgi:ubiquinone biosynthesis protein COQ4
MVFANKQSIEIHLLPEDVFRNTYHPAKAMLTSLKIPQTRQQSLLDSFIAIVEAKDGDFVAIDRLMAACSDRESLDSIIEHLSQYPHCQEALTIRPSLGKVDLYALHQLPTDNLGYHYADYMLGNQLQHLTMPPATNQREFIDVHMRETHDIWHVVTGSSIEMLGEIQLQGFCVAQLQLSRLWMALLTKNLVKSLVYDIEVADRYMTALTNGWLMGKAAQPLFGVDWTTLWETPIEQVRSSLNITISH